MRSVREFTMTHDELTGRHEWINCKHRLQLPVAFETATNKREGQIKNEKTLLPPHCLTPGKTPTASTHTEAGVQEA
jgi:hypothetical protein